MGIGQLIGVVAGALVVLVPVVRWLINDYIKKSEKLEEMKARNLRRLENEVKEFEKTLSGLRGSIHEHSSKIDTSSRIVKSACDRINEIEEKLKYYSQNMDKLVNKEVGKQVKTEIKMLTEQLMMVKNKNGK